MGRYGTNIRRLAQTDELNERIRQAEQKLSILEKSEIPGGRAIAYPSGSVQSGSPGVTNPDKNGSPDDTGIHPKKDTMNDNGIDDTTTDGDDLINGTKQLQKGEDPGAIQLKDCESGERIDVRFNTGANEGESKFKHPDGWGVMGPQNDPSYTAGRVWTIASGATAFYSNNFSGVISLREAVGPSKAYGLDGGGGTSLVTTLSPSYTEDFILLSGNLGGMVGNTAGSLGGTIYSAQAYAAGVAIGAGKYGQQDCGLASGDDTAACAADPPPQYNTWQEQDAGTPHQLAFSAQDGGFVSSKYDDSLPSKFDNDVGSGKGLNNLKLCTPDGNEVVVSALSDGTFAYFAEDGFGDPEADAKIFHFDSKGKYLDLIRPDEYDYLKSTNIPS